MKETHKKILGFTGLSVVAAVTTVAAVLPAPIAAAVGVTDQITVRVTSARPEVELTTTSGGTVTSNTYSFSVFYNHVSSLVITLVNKDDEGNTINTSVIRNIDSDGSSNSETINLNLDNYGGYGNFTITASGTGDDGVPVEQILNFVYEASEPTPPVDPENPDHKGDEEVDPGSGEADVPIDVPNEKVEQIVVNVIDGDGNIVKTITVTDPSEVENLDLSDVSNGTYTLEVVSKNGDGTIISSSESTVVVEKTKEEVTIEPQEEEIEKVVITITDKDGTVVDTIEINNPTPGQKVEVDLSDYPEGDYTITTEYFNEDDEKIDETETETSKGGGVNVPVKDQEGETIGQVVITVTDENGDVVKTIVLDNPQPGDVANVDLSDLDGGKYDINVDYFDEDGTKIGDDVIAVTKTDNTGNTDVNVETEVDTVTTITATVYDENGNIVRVVKADRKTGTVYVYAANGELLFTIPNGYRDDEELTIPFDGLEDGDYKTVITYEDANGKLVGRADSYSISYDGGSVVVVPDTGSFFRGLNISREDYLVTGLVVFMIISVVAFGIVARNRRNNKAASKKNRR